MRKRELRIIVRLEGDAIAIDENGEVADILAHLAADLKNGQSSLEGFHRNEKPLVDYNGNTIGSAKVVYRE